MTIANYMNVHGQRVAILESTITATWQALADSSQRCIDEVLSGDVFVNDQDSYIQGCKERKQQMLDNKADKVIPSGCELWWWQKAYYIQSGECVGILA